MTSLLVFTLLVGACGALLLSQISVVQATMDGTVFNQLQQPVGWFTWMEKTEGNLEYKAWLYFTSPQYRTGTYPVVMHQQGGILHLNVPELNVELYLNGTLQGLGERKDWEVSIGSYMLDSFSTAKVWFARETVPSTPQEENYPQLRGHSATAHPPLPSYRVETTMLSEGPILHIEVPLTLQPASTEATNGGILPTLRSTGTLTRGVEGEDIGTYEWLSATHVQVLIKGNNDDVYSATLKVDGSGTLEELWNVTVKLILKPNELPRH